MKVVSLVVVASLLLVMGCAKNPKSISAAYVSPATYQGYDCGQIRAEMLRVNAKLAEVAGVQSKERTKDSIAFATGMVLFWPALFFMIGDDKKEEIANLKGQYEALETCAIQAHCTDLLAEIEEAKAEPQ